MTPRVSLRSLCKALVVASWAALLATDILALEALVTADGESRRGRAALFTRGDACFALTPKHVLGGKQYATIWIPLGSAGVRSAQGDLCAEWLDDNVDLSLLRVTGHAVDGCGAPLTTATPVERLLPAGGAGTLRYSNKNGSTERVDVLVTFKGQEHVVGVRPRGSENPLNQGLSGSTLYLSDLPAGLLLAANESDEGEVLRLDHIVGLLNALFDKQQGAVVRDSTCLVTEALSTSEMEETGVDYAASVHGGQVVHWSVPAVSPVHRPDILISPPDRGNYWAVETSASAFVVVRLAAVRKVSRIDIDLSQVPLGQRPGSLSVFTRGAQTGPWTAAGWVQTTSTDASPRFAFAARRILEIRVGIDPKSDVPTVFGIGRVSVFN